MINAHAIDILIIQIFKKVLNNSSKENQSNQVGYMKILHMRIRESVCVCEKENE